MKRILVMGSTGSIGTQTLEIIRRYPDRFKAVGLTCMSRVDELREQIREFRPEAVCVGDEEAAIDLAFEFPEVEVFCGKGGLVEIAGMDCDIVLNALLGISGLAPTLEAIRAGRDIAIANKETLVAGGELVTEFCREKGVRLLPVDSEHSAIFQCLEGNGGSACGRAWRDPDQSFNIRHDGKKLKLDLRVNIEDSVQPRRPVRRILLTASGGRFRGRTLDSLRDVTAAQALKHPKWNMGAKISIDSATLMNKGLEVIEARWLFDVPADKIDIHVHPESIVHSMVEFCDGSIMAQLGLPDMKIPIGLALAYPDRLDLAGEDGVGSLDMFTTGSKLTFERPDREVFKCVDLAYEALRRGGVSPAVMNGANEELVALFLRGSIGFLDIQETIEKVMEKAGSAKAGSIEDILDADREARAKARELAGVKD